MAGMKKSSIKGPIVTQATTDIPVITTSSPTAIAPTATPSVFDTLDNIRLNTLGGVTNSTFVAGIDKSQGFYDLTFKSIAVTGDLVLTNNPDSIVLSLTQPEVIHNFIESGKNLSTQGGKVYSGVDGSAMTFRTLSVGPNLTLSQTTDTITIGLGFTPQLGNVSDAQNVGFSPSEINSGLDTRLGVFQAKDGTILKFRRIISANNIISVTPDSSGNQIVLSFDENNISLANLGGNFPASRVTGLSAVATTGNYNDLSNRPFVPARLNDLQDVSGTPINGNVLRYNGTQWIPGVLPDPNSIGRVKAGATTIAANAPNTQIEFVAGTELVVDGNAVTNRVSYNLKPTGVIAGSYPNPTVSVDTFGRITGIFAGSTAPAYVDPLTTVGDTLYRSAAGTTRLPIGGENQVLTVNGGIPRWNNLPASSGGSVSSVGIIGRNGITATGSPITSSGVIEVGLAPTGIAAGTFNMATITVDAFGRVTNAVSNSGGNTISINTGPGLQGGGDLTQSRTLSLTLTGATAGTYSNPTITVDVYGRISNVVAGGGGPGGGGVTSVNAVGANGINVSGGPITSSGTLNISLGNSGVIAGSYGVASLRVNAQGQVISADKNNPVPIGPGFINPAGDNIIDPSGGIYFTAYTTAQLQNKNHAVNQIDKELGKAVINLDNFRMYFASEDQPTSPWATFGNIPSDYITPV